MPDWALDHPWVAMSAVLASIATVLVIVRRLDRWLHRAHLSAAERSLVDSIADTFFPLDGPIPVAGSGAGAADYFQSHLRKGGRRQRSMMRLLLLFVQLSPLVFGPRRRRFTRLQPVERERFLRESSHSAIYLRRVVFISLRIMLTMAYLADDRVLERVGAVANLDPFGLGGVPPVPQVSGTRLKHGVTADDTDLAAGA